MAAINTLSRQRNSEYISPHEQRGSVPVMSVSKCEETATGERKGEGRSKTVGKSKKRQVCEFTRNIVLAMRTNVGERSSCSHQKALSINLTNCKYDSGKPMALQGTSMQFSNGSCSLAVRRVSRRFGLRVVGEEEEWTVYWTDTSVLMERVMDMKRFQVHFQPQR